MSSVIETNSPTQELDAGMMIRRALFLLVLVLFTLYYLALDFKGLSSATGMEQAQIAREIARGKNYQTKFIRPAALAQINDRVKEKSGNDSGISLMDVPETYQSPLNPLLNSMVLRINMDLFKFPNKGVIYTPDILIAGVSMVLLLSSIGINYLLISRIFDPRIGGVTACVMLLCELLWRYSQSGLPQMLMLFLFSFGMYFLYKAIENQQQSKSSFLWVALAGGFFALLGLSHWLTAWTFLGLLMFAAFYLQPRGIQMLILLGVYALITFLFAAYNIDKTGNVMGAGVYAFYAGGTPDALDNMMRDYRGQSGILSFDGFLTKTATFFISQLNDLYGYLGSIVAAPLFFLSLLHPFRRKEIADFRWCLLVMWGFSTLGMSIFGILPHSEQKIHTNNIHILFIPLFTAYGLAFLSVLWNRLNLPLHNPLVRNGHFALVILISAFPFLVNLPISIVGLSRIPHEFKRHHPYYWPRAIAAISSSVRENETIVSDIPWATAWYGDRVSIWLPKNTKQFYELQRYAQDKNEDIVGLYLSPTSLEKPMYSSVIAGNADWMPIMLRQPVAAEVGIDIMEKNTEFPFKKPIWLGSGTMFYTDQAREALYIEDLEKSRQ
jgi:hypothetical protein